MPCGAPPALGVALGVQIALLGAPLHRGEVVEAAPCLLLDTQSPLLGSLRGHKQGIPTPGPGPYGCVLSPLGRHPLPLGLLPLPHSARSGSASGPVHLALGADKLVPGAPLSLDEVHGVALLIELGAPPHCPPTIPSLLPMSACTLGAPKSPGPRPLGRPPLPHGTPPVAALGAPPSFRPGAVRPALGMPRCRAEALVFTVGLALESPGPARSAPPRQPPGTPSCIPNLPKCLPRPLGGPLGPPGLRPGPPSRPQSLQGARPVIALGTPELVPGRVCLASGLPRCLGEAHKVEPGLALGPPPSPLPRVPFRMPRSPSCRPVAPSHEPLLPERPPTPQRSPLGRPPGAPLSPNEGVVRPALGAPLSRFEAPIAPPGLALSAAGCALSTPGPLQRITRVATPADLTACSPRRAWVVDLQMAA
mmetsp:Transcript_135825/g.352195  ORF Transcript_135825/g.352195 Transcript_135825/m.352195 type:complete len:420 (-) Transcript_135825:671-1930(-)